MVGLGKPQQYAKFEVASFSCCTDIQILKGNPNILRAHLALGHVHFFLGMEFYDGPLQNPSRVPDVKSLASAVAEKS